MPTYLITVPAEGTLTYKFENVQSEEEAIELLRNSQGDLVDHTVDNAWNGDVDDLLIECKD